MELIQIIYTSLLIAGGILLVTIIISYVSYKVRQNGNDNEEEVTKPVAPAKQQTYNYEQSTPSRKEYQEKYPPKEKYSSERRKEIKEEEFYRHSSKSSPRKKEEPYNREEEYRVKAPPSVRKIEPERRIEILKDLRTGRPEENTQQQNRNIEPEPNRKNTTDENTSTDNKDRKKLKSIKDDPLNKYSDSSDDDDFQPLKTDN